MGHVADDMWVMARGGRVQGAEAENVGVRVRCANDLFPGRTRGRGRGGCGAPKGRCRAAMPCQPTTSRSRPVTAPKTTETYPERSVCRYTTS